MSTKEIILSANEKMQKAFDSVVREFSQVRTGRASASLVEGLHVDYYGTPTLLKQIASIAVPDARLITIQPWDASVLPEIEKSILKANLGITPINDNKVIRLSIPQLSLDRREELAKQVKNMSEAGRVSLRTIRRDIVEEIRKLEKDGKIPEDDKFRIQEEIQKITDKFIERIDKLLLEKEKEITEF